MKEVRKETGQRNIFLHIVTWNRRSQIRAKRVEPEQRPVDGHPLQLTVSRGEIDGPKSDDVQQNRTFV